MTSLVNLKQFEDILDDVSMEIYNVGYKDDLTKWNLIFIGTVII
jgi:hypothetical protein